MISPDLLAYIRQNRTTYTREILDAQLLAAGYTQADVEEAWRIVLSDQSGIPDPPSGVERTPDWGDRYGEQRSRQASPFRSPRFWATMIGFILLSYVLVALGTVRNVPLLPLAFIGLQLAAIFGGILWMRDHRPLGVGLLMGVLMAVVVLPIVGVAILFGYCLVGLGTI